MIVFGAVNAGRRVVGLFLDQGGNYDVGTSNGARRKRLVFDFG